MSDPNSPKEGDGAKKPEGSKDPKDPKKIPTATEAEEELEKAKERRAKEEQKLMESRAKLEKMQVRTARVLTGEALTTSGQEGEGIDETETDELMGFDSNLNTVNESPRRRQSFAMQASLNLDESDEDNEEVEDDLYGNAAEERTEGATGGAPSMLGAAEVNKAAAAAAAAPQGTNPTNRADSRSTGALNKKTVNAKKKQGNKATTDIAGWTDHPTGKNIQEVAKASGINISDDSLEVIRDWVRRTLEAQMDHGFDISADIISNESVFDVKKYMEKSGTTPQNDPKLRELKERAIYTIMSGLVLFLAKFDVTTLATVPVTDKRIVTFILANLLPRMITANPLSMDNIGEEGLDQLIFNLASAEMPLDVLVAMHVALANRVADILHELQSLKVSPKTRARFLQELTSYLGTSSNVFGRLQMALAVASNDDAFALDPNSDYLRILQDIALKAVPAKANEIMESVHDMLDMMYKQGRRIGEAEMRRMMDVTGRIHNLHAPHLEKAVPPPGKPFQGSPLGKGWGGDPLKKADGSRSILQQPYALPTPPPPTPPFKYPESLEEAQAVEKEVQSMVAQMRKEKGLDTSKAVEDELRSILKGASPGSQKAKPEIFSSTRSAGAGNLGNATMGGSFVNMSAIKQPAQGAPFLPAKSPAEESENYFKPFRKDPTLLDMVKSYRGRPPAGGFGVDNQSLRDELGLPDVGVFGSNLDRELSLTSNRKGGDNLGVFSKAAGAAIQNSSKAKELADNLDMSKANQNEALNSMAQQLKFLSAAVAPDNLRAMFSKDGMKNEALKLHRRYKVVPVPPLGTENFRLSDRKDVLCMLGNAPWKGIGRKPGLPAEKTDKVDSHEFFSAVYSIIENKLSAQGAINLLKTVGDGEFARAVRDFSSDVSFPHIWRQLTVWFKTTTDFSALERRKIDIKSKRPKNISSYTRNIMDINHRLSMEVPEEGRKKYEIDLNRKDLAHVVYTYFPALVEDIIASERRDFQEWADRRETARLAGYNPDLVPSLYHPFLELSHSIVQHVELVYGASVMQPEDEAITVGAVKKSGLVAAIEGTDLGEQDEEGGTENLDVNDDGGAGNDVAAVETPFPAAPGLKTNLACSLCRGIGHIHRDCHQYPGSSPAATLCRFCRAAHPGFCKDKAAPPKEKQ